MTHTVCYKTVLQTAVKTKQEKNKSEVREVHFAAF